MEQRNTLNTTDNKLVKTIHYQGFTHHILYSLEHTNAVDILNLFKKEIGDEPIGFDMEWISIKQFPYINYTEHVELMSKEIICTIQFGYKNISIVCCLHQIYNNDHIMQVIPEQLINFLTGELICFGGGNDLRKLRANYPSSHFTCRKMWDPIVRLKALGAGRPNLRSMSQLLLGFKSNKFKSNIDWINATSLQLIDAGEDAILSYLIYNYIKNTEQQVLSQILTEHTCVENTKTRRKHIISCSNEIIRKVMCGLDDNKDNIYSTDYTRAMTSFLSTMKFPPMEITYISDENINWKSKIIINLYYDKIEDYGIAQTKKKSRTIAIRNILNNPKFCEILNRFL